MTILNPLFIGSDGLTEEQAKNLYVLSSGEIINAFQFVLITKEIEIENKNFKEFGKWKEDYSQYNLGEAAIQHTLKFYGKVKDAAKPGTVKIVNITDGTDIGSITVTALSLQYHSLPVVFPAGLKEYELQMKVEKKKMKIKNLYIHTELIVP